MQSGRVLRVAVVGGLGISLGFALVIGARGQGEPKPRDPGFASADSIRGWKKGKGWGWIWGKDDEVVALNAMTDASRAAALAFSPNAARRSTSG